MKKVLGTLNKRALKVNLEKSTLFKDKVVFLGRAINGSTKSTKDESVEKVRNIAAAAEILGNAWSYPEFHQRPFENHATALKTDVERRKVRVVTRASGNSRLPQDEDH